MLRLTGKVWVIRAQLRQLAKLPLTLDEYVKRRQALTRPKDK